MTRAILYLPCSLYLIPREVSGQTPALDAAATCHTGLHVICLHKGGGVRYREQDVSPIESILFDQKTGSDQNCVL